MKYDAFQHIFRACLKEDIADVESILRQWFQPGGLGGSVGVTSFHLVLLTG